MDTAHDDDREDDPAADDAPHEDPGAGGPRRTDEVQPPRLGERLARYLRDAGWDFF